MKPTDASALVNKPVGACPGATPSEDCTAECSKSEQYSQKGTQLYDNGCSAVCTIDCNEDIIVRGAPSCPDSRWDECSEICVQSRTVGIYDADQKSCVQNKETRKCYTASCETKSGDYLVFIDFKVKKLSPDEWSYAFGDTFIKAISKMFDVSESSIEILSEAGGESSPVVKLHFELRLSLSDYQDSDNNGVSDLFDAAQSIPEIVNSDFFPGMFLTQLQAVSDLNDKIDYR